MLDRHYKVLGCVVRNAEREVLSDLELGKVIAQYVEVLNKEAERDERDIYNGKGERNG